ncbi:hypothetical protein SERLA73DRAFT_155730 [Serpula lacrymans var. lacrymans S7.3]|uniref:Uncharacterized protein n=1 Tax=Serpula lacrymans var. lacrymans (strain S7.3) TaxID=936435 RepID=F8QB59_SERL3|nr:hypothetical protein SERLA73DRAFT_155730 [Serpula lacrymans var. lacrymans S7.3]
MRTGQWMSFDAKINETPFKLEGERETNNQAVKNAQIVDIDSEAFNHAPLNDPCPHPPDPQNDPHPAQAPLFHPPMVPRRSTHHQQPAQYMCNLLQGERSVDGTSKGQVLPKGMQNPLENAKDLEGHADERNNQTLRELAQNVTLAAHMANLDDIELRTIEEAQKHPDWDKWKDAINERLERLKAAGTWTYVDRPKVANIVGIQ